MKQELDVSSGTSSAAETSVPHRQGPEDRPHAVARDHEAGAAKGGSAGEPSNAREDGAESGDGGGRAQAEGRHPERTARGGSRDRGSGQSAVDEPTRQQSPERTE